MLVLFFSIKLHLIQFTIHCRKTSNGDEILIRMDLSVKEIADQYPNLNEENVSRNDILTTTKTIVDELKAIFEDQVIQRSGKWKFE